MKPVQPIASAHLDGLSAALRTPDLTVRRENVSRQGGRTELERLHTTDAAPRSLSSVEIFGRERFPEWCVRRAASLW
jgi:hypothetical protein